MSDITPSRSALIALVEERRSFHEGYVFLDEKCLLLAGAILREIGRFEQARIELEARRREAAGALAAAVSRLGLEGLQSYPTTGRDRLELALERESLLGVALQSARLDLPQPVTQGLPLGTVPEAEEVRTAFGSLSAHLAAMAAIAGNLERLCDEYRRTVRRARALQDVLLPEIDQTVREMDSLLEELERDEATWLHHSRRL